MRTAIMGAGFVGLSTAACLSWLGHQVSLFDVDETKIRALQAGNEIFYEPGLTELLQLTKQHLNFTSTPSTALDGADIIFIAVGTPPRQDGSPDLVFVESAIRSIAQHASREFTVVANKSTVPVGTARQAESQLNRYCGKGCGLTPTRSFAVASTPEFLSEGTALHNSLYPDRIVIGAESPRSLDMLTSLYDPILSQSFEPPPFLPRPQGLTQIPLVLTDSVSAELIKYASNAFLATKISYINELGWLSEKVGADISQVAKGIGLDSRIGNKFLRPGIGWGGSCFGKDTAALLSMAAARGLAMPIVASARAINQQQRTAVVERLHSALNGLAGRRVGLLGLAFKPDTNDLRDSPALEIAGMLVQAGASVTAHDPVALPCARIDRLAAGIDLYDDVQLVFRGADAVLCMTEWPQYHDLPWSLLLREMRTPFIFDGRLFLDRAQLQAAGFQYLSFGS